MAKCKRFTHFVDNEDGSGDYKDYDSQATVLRRHGAAIKRSGTIRSWIEEYDPETGDGVRRLADWFPAMNRDVQAA